MLRQKVIVIAYTFIDKKEYKEINLEIRFKAKDKYI